MSRSREMPCASFTIVTTGPALYTVAQIRSLEDVFNFSLTDETVQMTVDYTNLQGKMLCPGLDQYQRRMYVCRLLPTGVYRPHNQEPVLSKEQPAFQYSSHVSLQAPSGHMWGTFRIERTDGSHFDVRIPPFSLESNKDDKAPPAGYTF